MFLQASSVRENSADVVGTTCNTLLCRQKSLPFALRDAKGMKSFSFFLLKKYCCLVFFFKQNKLGLTLLTRCQPFWLSLFLRKNTIAVQ